MIQSQCEMEDNSVILNHFQYIAGDSLAKLKGLIIDIIELHEWDTWFKPLIMIWLKLYINFRMLWQ